jgi:hypothetical protein
LGEVILKLKYLAYWIGFSTLGVSLLTFAQSSSPSVAARDLMIEKLQRVTLSLPETDTARVGVTLRLADLLSERARASYKNELGGTATAGSEAATRKDRDNALRFYREALPHIKGDAKGRVLIQMGHLQQMNGQEVEALKTYAEISRSDYNDEIKAEAELSAGDIHFLKRRFKEAQKSYELTLTRNGKTAKGYASYRLAWTHHYLGQGPQGIALLEKILSTPALLTRSAQIEVIEPDQQFQEEISRDLVTFVVQNKGGLAEAEKIYALSPEKARLANVFFMATELERLGQKKASIDVYTFVLQKESRLPFKLEGQIRVAQLEMEQKQIEPSIMNYEKATLLWTDACGQAAPDDLQCREITSRLKNYIIDWHKLERAAPSESLQKAYSIYLGTFKEGDLFVQGSLVARQRKDYVQSTKWLEDGVKAYLAKTPVDADKVETTLLAQIETAELAKDSNMHIHALQNYLAQSVKKARALDVEYQLAKLTYDSGDNAKASEQLHAVAVSKSAGSATLRATAADLSLDALGLLKDNTKIKVWAAEYAQLFPAQKGEFVKVASKAAINESAELSTTAPAAALAALAEIDMSALNHEDKVLFLKNKIILLEKTQNWSEARISVDTLLATPNLSVSDRDFALEHKANLAELVLDFKTAYKALQQQTSKASLYRLALLADLSSEDASQYLTAQLEKTTDENEKLSLASKIILDSKNPEKEWMRLKGVFTKHPDRYADLAQAIFARLSRDPARSKVLVTAVKANAALKTTEGYRIIVREDIFDRYEKLNASLAAHNLQTVNDKKLAQTIRERAKFLETADKLAQESIQLGDFTSQVLTLSLLGREEQRFYSELIGLPIPAGLTPEEKQQYMAMLSEQAGPHRVKAEDVTTKAKSFWAEATAFETLSQNYAKSDSQARSLLKREIELLSSLAEEPRKTQLASVLTTPEQQSQSVAGVESARDELRRDPMNKQKIAALISLEKQSGGDAMVSYLEQRMKNLEPSAGANK